MQQSIVEIIHRLSFELSGKGLDEAIRKLKEQAAGVDALKSKEEQLNTAIQQGNKLSVNEMQRLSNERAKVRKLIDDETAALKNNFTQNKALQAAMQQEIKVMQALTIELDRLKEARANAGSRNEVRRIEQQMSNAIQSSSAILSKGVIRQFTEFNSVGGAFNQILRELPNAGISARTFVLSLTNNVSYLGEAFARARAEGQSWGQILKGGIASSLFGLVGIINIAITALTFLALEYDKNSREAEELEQDVDNLTAAIADQIKTVRELADLRREANATLSPSEAAEKRRIQLLKAQGATEEEIFSAEQKLFKLRSQNRRDELNSLDNVISRTGELFDFYNKQGLTQETVNERVATELTPTILENAESTPEEARKQAEAVVQSYRERNGKIITLEKQRLQVLQDINDIDSERNINIIEFQKKINGEIEKEEKKKPRNINVRVKPNLTLAPPTELVDEEAEFFRKITEYVDTIEGVLRKKGIAIDVPLITGLENDISQPSGSFRTQPTGEQTDIKENALLGLSSDITKKQIADQKEAESAEDKIQQQRLTRIRETIDAYKDLASTVAQAFDVVIESQIRSLDTEISLREKRVETARALAERGNAEILQEEENRLNESLRQREIAARRQQTINAALIVSESLVAVASAAAQSKAGAIVIVPAVIAAIAAGFAAVTTLSQDSTPSFADGVIGFRGKGTGTSDSNIARISNGESVITAEGTSKNRALLEAINKGYEFNIPQLRDFASPATGLATKIELTTLESKMDGIIEAVENNGFKQNISLDERGFSLFQEKKMRKQKAFHKR